MNTVGVAVGNGVGALVGAGVGGRDVVGTGVGFGVGAPVGRGVGADGVGDAVVTGTLPPSCAAAILGASGTARITGATQADRTSRRVNPLFV